MTVVGQQIYEKQHREATNWKSYSYNCPSHFSHKYFRSVHDETKWNCNDWCGGGCVTNWRNDRQRLPYLPKSTSLRVQWRMCFPWLFFKLLFSRQCTISNQENKENKWDKNFKKIENKESLRFDVKQSNSIGSHPPSLFWILSCLSFQTQ